MIHSIGISISNISPSPIFLGDVDVGKSFPFTRAGAVYIPPGETVELVYTSSTALSFERGSIRGFIEQGKIIASVVQGSSSPAAKQLVYSPNGVNNPGAQVFTNFSDLYTVFQNTPGSIEIYLDYPNGLSGVVVSLPPEFRTFPIPSGIYDFEYRAHFSGSISSVLSIVDFGEAGTIIDRLLGAEGAVGFYNRTPNPVIKVGEIVPFSPAVFYLDRGAMVASEGGSAPVIEVAVGSSPFPQSVLGILHGSALNAGSPAIRIAPNGTLILFTSTDAEVQADSIEGDGTTFIFSLIAASSSLLNFTQPSFLGTQIQALNQVSQFISYDPTQLADWNGNPPIDLRTALDRIAAAVGPIT
jgi:hypothetical protein